jgi:hypothetical protein
MRPDIPIMSSVIKYATETSEYLLLATARESKGGKRREE